MVSTTSDSQSKQLPDSFLKQVKKQDRYQFVKAKGLRRKWFLLSVDKPRGFGGINTSG
jgi:hypothetical protein